MATAEEAAWAAWTCNSVCLMQSRKPRFGGAFFRRMVKTVGMAHDPIFRIAASAPKADVDNRRGQTITLSTCAEATRPTAEAK